MSIALDGFEVFRQVGKHAEIFAAIRADVDQQARSLVAKCLKARSFGVGAFRDIRKALGQEQFGLALEGLKETELKSLLTRLDKHHPGMKGGAIGWRRQHLNALADGSSKPHAPPTKAKKASGKKTRDEPARLRSEVVDVCREGGKKMP